MHIEKINISDPCPEDIDLMDGESSERHCDKCDKSVHNLSSLSRDEAEALLDANQGRDICINYVATRSGEVDFFKQGDPRPSRDQLAGVKKLLLAAIMVPVIFTQPAIVPAKVAVNSVIESVEQNEGPIDIIKNIVKAENALLNRLENDYGFNKVVVQKFGGANNAVVTDVTF